MLGGAFFRRTARLMVQRQGVRALSLPAHQVVGLPALSPTMDAGTIASWKVNEGASFVAGDVIAEIETDKATMDFVTEDDGFLAKILVPANSGETKVGDPIMVIVEDEADVGAFKDFEAPAGAPAAKPESAPEPEPEPAPAPAAAEKPSSSPPAEKKPASSSSANNSRVFASPLARKIAGERGIDLSMVEGTGPGGRIVKDDVENYVAAPAEETETQATAPSSKQPSTTTTTTPEGAVDFAVTPTSAAIAARLAYSMQTAPHYYLTVDLNLGPALELLATLNAGLEDDSRISLTDFFIKASASATKTVPSVNSSWLDGGIIRQYKRFDVNLVVGVNEGLYAPVLIDVQRLGLKDIADATKKAIEALDDPDASPEAYATGTFTLSNLGAFGVASAAPIVHSPQACALALGTVEQKVVPSSDPDKNFALQPTLTATLAADHRVVDGAVGAQWLQALKGLVEAPHNILL